VNPGKLRLERDRSQVDLFGCQGAARDCFPALVSILSHYWR